MRKGSENFPSGVGYCLRWVHCFLTASFLDISRKRLSVLNRKETRNILLLDLLFAFHLRERDTSQWSYWPALNSLNLMSYNKISRNDFSKHKQQVWLHFRCSKNYTIMCRGETLLTCFSSDILFLFPKWLTIISKKSYGVENFSHVGWHIRLSINTDKPGLRDYEYCFIFFSSSKWK